MLSEDLVENCSQNQQKDDEQPFRTWRDGGVRDRFHVTGGYFAHSALLSVLMAGNNDFAELDRLTDAVLAEVVREGELEIQAQLQTSLAADSRALTISGSCLTAATALFGAAAALSKTEPLDYPLMLVAIAMGVALLVSAGLAIHSARPIDFGFPGNDPENWLPAGWRSCTGRGYALKRARIEQAMVLQENIVKNRRSASRNASLVQAALRVSYGATLAAAAAIIAIVATRAC